MIKLRKKQKGFTLVELLIVIAIIAVLAAVVTPVALNAISKSKATAVYAEIKSIETAYLSEFVGGDVTGVNSVDDLELSGVQSGGNSNNATYGLSVADSKATLTVTVANSFSDQLVSLITNGSTTADTLAVTPLSDYFSVIVTN